MPEVTSPAPHPPDLAVDKILGVVDLLSESEEATFQGCEAIILLGWHKFVEVGLALAQIRDGRLYRVEFDTFEAYCRAKWDYGRRQVDHLISAAQLFTHLRTNCSRRKPDRESQLRPLVGLTPEQAQLAWEYAAEKAGGRKITARLVKSAMRELQLTGTAKPVAQEPRQTKAKQRRLIGDAFGELLMLLSQKASYEILTERVEVLHGHFQSLLAKANTHHSA